MISSEGFVTTTMNDACSDYSARYFVFNWWGDYQYIPNDTICTHSLGGIKLIKREVRQDFSFIHVASIAHS